MLFQIYGETALYQLLGFVLVFTGLVLANEFARRTKTGGIICFLVLPAVLTVYFIAIAIGAHAGAEWALNNQTYTNMNSWFHYAKLYAATAGCIGFMMLKYKWSIGKTEWFKVFPFAIVAINILIAVASDFESGIRGAMALKEFGDRWWLSSENVWLYGGWWNWVNGIAGIVNIFCMTAWWGRQRLGLRVQQIAVLRNFETPYHDGHPIKYIDGIIKQSVIRQVGEEHIQIHRHQGVSRYLSVPLLHPVDAER